VSSNAEILFGNIFLGRKGYGCHGNTITLNSKAYSSFLKRDKRMNVCVYGLFVE
jgi:hypothetical protein